MKFLELHLKAYGPFTDYALDLSENSFHLIFGPNEAGKSTTLRAIDALMFGIPSRTPDNFLHKYAEMKVGARVANQKGRELAFLRLKRTKKSLANLDEPQKPLAENVLDDFLKGMDRDRFNRLYCIDHDEFRSGGELMRDLKGLANDSLIAASHGGGFSEVGKQLLDEADTLWSAKKRNSRIKKSIEQLNEAKKARAAHSVRAAEWKSINDDLEKLRESKRAIAEESTKLQSQQNRLKRLLEALPLVTQWSGLNAQLAEHDEIRVLPEAYSAEERIRCVADLASLTSQHKTLDTKLCQLESEIESAKQLPDVLRATEQIEALQRRVESYRQSCDQLAEDELKMDAALRAMQRALDELGWDVSAEEFTSQREKWRSKLHVKSEVRAAINDLIPDEQQLRERPSQLEHQLRELKSELKDVITELDAIESVVDCQSLEFAIREASQHLHIERSLSDLTIDQKTLRAQCDRELTQLPGWSGTLEDLTRSPIPLRETVDHFRKERLKLDSKIESLTGQLKATRDDLLQTRERIAASQRASAVVTEDDLSTTRAERDRGWQLIKKTKLKGDEDAAAVHEFAGTHTLEDAFEQKVTEADTIADRLRREAKRVGELTQQQEREARLCQEQATQEHELKELQGELSKLEREWTTLWENAGITDVRSPQEMLAWLDVYRGILDQSQTMHELNTKFEVLQQQHQEQAKTLTEALVRFESGEPAAVDAEKSLRKIHARAESVLALHRVQERKREQRDHDRKRLERNIANISSALEIAKRELEAWNARWDAAMTAIDCDAEYTGARVMARLSCLDALRTASEDSADAQDRVTRSKEQISAFESEVGSLYVRLDGGDSELGPIDCANWLQSQLQKGRSLQQADAQRRSRRDELSGDIEKIVGEVDALNTKLTQFCTMAGVEVVDALDTVEQISRLAVEKNQVGSELRRVSGGDEFEQFLQEAAEADVDTLKAQIAELDAEIAEASTKRDNVVAEITATEAKRDEFDGSDAAAKADQLAMNRLSEIHTDARQYVVLRIAESILRQQVERYRDENKDPLLSRASQYFAEMTCNEFSGLESDYDEQGQPIIVAQRRTGDCIRTTAMSDGTLDPLFLSLRLAYLYNKVTLFEPMPLIVDDILIHLDDSRALATMKVLSEFSRYTQVLFFTHHYRLRELAEANLSNDVLQVHELERVDAERKARPR